MAKFARKKKQGCQTPKCRMVYVARNVNDRIYIYDEEPERGKQSFHIVAGTRQELPEYAFPQVTWTNSPWKASLTLEMSIPTGEPNSYDRYYDK